MTALIRELRSDRTQRLIDWSVFAAGAGSLAVALVLTAAGLMTSSPVTAQADAPATLVAEI